MEYLELLTRLRDFTKKAEELKRALMTSSNADAETQEVISQNNAYMRFETERRSLLDEAMRTIRTSSDPEMMKSLYFRRVLNIPWEKVPFSIPTDRSEMDLRIAAYEYVKARFPQWGEYSDCI